MVEDSHFQKAIEEWLDKNCSPKWDKGTRLARTNATNFHHAIHAIEEAKKMKEVYHLLNTNQFSRFIDKFGRDYLEKLIETDEKARRLASNPEISK